MKFMKSLLLATGVMAMGAAYANPNFEMNVHFAKGSDHAALNGVVKGKDYDVYRFNAAKGQLLSLQMHNTPPQIATALVFFQGNRPNSGATSLILPYSGTYELRVMKSHADAMNNIARPYNVVLSIKNAPKAEQPNSSWVYYLCDGSGKMKVLYKDLNGKFPTAKVSYNGHSYNLSYDRRYSYRNDNMVFSDKRHTLSLDRSQSKDPNVAKVFSFTEVRNGNSAIVVQECQPQ